MEESYIHKYIQLYTYIYIRLFASFELEAFNDATDDRQKFTEMSHNTQVLTAAVHGGKNQVSNFLFCRVAAQKQPRTIAVAFVVDRMVETQLRAEEKETRK